MSSPRVDVISIGCLNRNLLWGEQEAVRTSHTTTVLIRSGKRNILVDPGLPGPVIAARLYERTGLRPGQIDTVFLTNFRPDHRSGLGAFSSAKFLLHEMERDALMPQLERMRDSVGRESEDAKVIEEEMALLESMENAPDKLAPGVDLFPLPGFTPGTCGLLVSMTSLTVLVAGDAVPTQEHFLAMQLLPESADLKQAGESMREVYEIADLIVPGHDNLFMNPRTMGI